MMQQSEAATFLRYPLGFTQQNTVFLRQLQTFLAWPGCNLPFHPEIDGLVGTRRTEERRRHGDDLSTSRVG